MRLSAAKHAGTKEYRQYSLQIRASQARKHQDRYHESHERTSRTTNVHAKGAQIPRPGPKPIADEKDTDEDGYGEGDECCDGSNGKQRASCEGAPEDKKNHEDPEGRVEPDSINRSMGVFVDTLNPPRAGKAVVAGIGEGNPGSSNLYQLLVDGLYRVRWAHWHTMQP